jgi:ATP-dependent DNA helicase RecG
MPRLPKLDPTIRELLERPEGVRYETKRVSNRMVQRALETICAFSNTEGGLLILGVEDSTRATGKDRLFGLSENREAVAELKRKLRSHFLPAIEEPRFLPWTVTNREGAEDQILVVRVSPGNKVHTILDDGTWLRVESTNREMNAAEITTLSYKRGVVSAESELVDVSLELLDTEALTAYCGERGISTGTLAQRLEKIGLARNDQGKCSPTRAAVLLFADSPSDLLAPTGSRAGVRVFHYSGVATDRSESPNLRNPPKSFSAPVYGLIARVTDYVLEEISTGFTMAQSGFEAKHQYPKRVIKEAITNAVLHRDYRFQRDVHVRIFDDRIEVESPGEFIANITPATIETAGSAPRNPSLVGHLREFPAPPNVDAGEGVPMMFSEMKAKGLYPPRYAVHQETAVPTVTVTLLNEARPAIWEQVSAYIDKHGEIANRNLREIANVETLHATRMLKGWVALGLLVMSGSGKKNTVYKKPSARDPSDDLLLFNHDAFDKNTFG